MLTEEEVFCSVTPICSAIDMKRLLKTSSNTGSAPASPASPFFPLAFEVPSAACRTFFSMRVSRISLRAVISADQPGSTITVWFGSTISAGPLILAPSPMASRR